MALISNILIICFMQMYPFPESTLTVPYSIEQILSLEDIEVLDNGDHIIFKTSEPINDVFVQLLDRAYNIIYNKTIDIKDGAKIVLPEIKPINRKLTLILKKESLNVVRKLYD